MTASLLVSLALRGSLLLGAAYGAASLLPRASAALRRLVLALGFGASLALPLVALGLPGRPVARVLPAPAAVRVFAEALSLDGAPLGPALSPGDARAPVPLKPSFT